MARNQNCLVVGPSHVNRLKNLVTGGGLPNSFRPENLIGVPGAPVWSKKLLDQASAQLAADQPICMIVGDFRFGNGICIANPRPEGLFADGFVAIDQAAMSGINDRELLARSIVALKEWQKQFPQMRFLLWDLFGRQTQDMFAGRYIVDGKYRHPSWTLEEVEAELAALNLIPLAPLMAAQSPEEIMRLIIDGSNHPSQAGYQFLANLFIEGMSAVDAFESAIAGVEERLARAGAALRERQGADVVLTGLSVWLDAMVRYLGPRGIMRMREVGMWIAPLNSQSEASRDARLPEQATYVFIAPDALSEAQAFDLISKNGVTPPDSHCRVVVWEARSEAAITARRETPRFQHRQPPFIATPVPQELALPSSWVEFGPSGFPTGKGLADFLDEL